jgi:hypothetical protein
MVDRDMQKVLAKLSWYINVESYQKDGEQPPDEFFESLRNNLKEIIIFFGPKNFCYFLKKKNLYSQSQRKQFLRKLLEYDHTNAPAVDCFINIFEEILNNYKEDTTDLFTGVRLYEHLVNNIHTESSVFSKIKNHKIAVFSALGVSALIGFLTKRTWLPPVKKLVNQLKSRKTHSGKII